VFPVNVQSFSMENNVLKNLSSVWNYWLEEDTIKEFGKAGYYS
jgi:hypothetical protein